MSCAWGVPRNRCVVPPAAMPLLGGLSRSWSNTSPLGSKESFSVFTTQALQPLPGVSPVHFPRRFPSRWALSPEILAELCAWGSKGISPTSGGAAQHPPTVPRSFSEEKIATESNKAASLPHAAAAPFEWNSWVIRPERSEFPDGPGPARVRFPASPQGVAGVHSVTPARLVPAGGCLGFSLLCTKSVLPRSHILAGADLDFTCLYRFCRSSLR